MTEVTTKLNLLTLPNALTVVRVLTAPVFIVGYMRGDAAGYIVALCALFLSECTDIFDGNVARAFNQVSKIGKLLDPMADTVTRFCMLLGLLGAGILPFWMIFVFFVRDISIAYIRAFAASEGFVIAARISGKVKAVAQATALFVITEAMVIQHQDVFLSDPFARKVLFISTIIAFSLPVAFLLIIRLHGFALKVTLLLIFGIGTPVYLMFFIQRPPLNYDLIIQLALWIATLITAYSLFDYTKGFINIMLNPEQSEKS